MAEEQVDITLTCSQEQTGIQLKYRARDQTNQLKTSWREVL